MYQLRTQTLFQIPEIKISYHNKVKFKNRRQIINSQSAYDVFMDSWDLTKIELVEQCKLIMLDLNSACLGISDIATGALSGCLVDPKIIYATALKARTSRIILAHNHPSGIMKPSEADDKLTKQLQFAGNVLDIHFADHLIVSTSKYYSYADNGRMPL